MPDEVMLGAVNQVMGDPFIEKTNFSHWLVFNKDKENELADYLKTSSAMFNGLSTKATKKLAYEFALRN